MNISYNFSLSSLQGLVNSSYIYPINQLFDQSGIFLDNVESTWKNKLDKFPKITLVTLFNHIVIYCDKAVAKHTVDKLPEMEQNDNNNKFKRVI